ncbi:MAG: sensor histidine kinase [Thermoplasmatota archaeon]
MPSIPVAERDHVWRPTVTQEDVSFLRRFLFWSAAAAFILGAGALAVGGVPLPVRAVQEAAALLLLLSGLLLLARALVLIAGAEVAVQLAAYGFLIYTATFGLVAPWYSSRLALTCVLAGVFGLLHLHGTRLKILFGATWLTSLAMSVVSFRTGPPLVGYPMLNEAAIFGPPITVALLLWILFRLRIILDTQSQRIAQAAIHQAEEEVARFRSMDAFRTRFINSAAHELRTPLTPIFLHLHLLEREEAGRLDERHARSVAVIRRNAVLLNRLVNETLDVARHEAGKLELRPRWTDLRHLVETVGHEYGRPAADRGIALDVVIPTTPVMADVDAERVEQVLLNLLNNAFRFTPRGGSICVRLSVADSIRLSVEDSGRGIAPADLPRLFAPFTQVGPDVPGAPQGAGLGLYLSRAIIEAHGGKIWCESPGIDQGTTFVIEFVPGPAPANPAPPVGAAEAARASAMSNASRQAPQRETVNSPTTAAAPSQTPGDRPTRA